MHCSKLVGFLLLIVIAAGLPLHAQEPLPLIQPSEELGGWSFGNGPEFPGAKGELKLVDETGVPTLELHGDFSGGGTYVQAACRLPDVSIESLSFDVKVPAGVGQLTTRLIDGSGQCHQLRVRLNDKGGWQTFKFPVARYFESLQSGAPMDIVTGYEKWSGANDGNWHQPAKLIVFLAGREQLGEGFISFRNINLQPTPPTTEIQRTIQVGNWQTGNQSHPNEAKLDWAYNNGNEFAGAVGGASIVDGPRDDVGAVRLEADFRNGGAYVGIRKPILVPAAKRLKQLRMKLRSDSVESFSMRLVDGESQTHQRGGIKVTSDGKWHQLTITPDQFVGQEHWGGANDGLWRGSLALVEIMLNKRSSITEQGWLEIADIEADFEFEARTTSDSVSFNFQPSEKGDRPIDSWNVEGDVRIMNLNEEGQLALQLRRRLEDIAKSTTATGPRFRIRPGLWKLSYQFATDLHSPDNSYHAAIEFALLDDDGKLIESVPVNIHFGILDWQLAEAQIRVPSEAAFGQWVVKLNKTYGSASLDDLNAMRLEVEPLEPKVEAIRIKSESIGQLFFPEDKVRFELQVDTLKPLEDFQTTADVQVRDYWGALQSQPLSISLLPSSTGSANRYHAEFELNKDHLNVGQYYELRIRISEDEGNVAEEMSGFAILPEAITKSLPAESVPFTIRNWDNRVRDYFYLADRLGLKQIGIWGGWQQKAPYVPHGPGIELCEQLNAVWLTTTPCAQVERQGFGTVTEESLREGVTNFLEEFAERGLSKIALGNEPHGTGEKVLENVRAYKITYEAIKKFDPNISVIGTSVEPNEEYFKAGYQDYLDAYDFHIYEHYSAVRRTFREYRELMEKYDAVKPVHSTELGLNSQGQARLAVANELIKKFTVFFAEGGETVSWFTIQYPDPQGKARGQFGDSHCVFDCKYNLFNPRLDAIAYYHMINQIAAKRFVEEKQFENGLQAFRFADESGNEIQIWWNDSESVVRQLDFPEGMQVKVTQIDGRSEQLFSDQNGITLSISDTPVIVSYQVDNNARVVHLTDAPQQPTESFSVKSTQTTDGPLIEVARRMSSDDESPHEFSLQIPHGWQQLPVSDGTTRIKIDSKYSENTKARMYLLSPSTRPSSWIVLPLDLAN